MMSKEKCPESIELTRAVSEGLTPALRAHLEECESCATEWKALNELLDMGKDLPFEEPTPERLDQVRLGIYAGALSYDSPSRRGRRAFQPLPLMAMAAVALVLIGLAAYGLMPFVRADRTPESARTLVLPQGVATYSVEAELPNQIIRLVDGTIRVTVKPLAPGESVRVVVGNSHVVVHGTQFDVAAQANRLIDVRVLHGQVEVRQHGRLPVMLATGSRLTDDPSYAALASEPTPEMAGQTKEVAQAPVNPPEKPKIPEPAVSLPGHGIAPAKPSDPAPAPLSTVSHPPKSQVEIAFEEGWRELKARRYSTAADAFSRAKSKDPANPLAEDAAYWLAVALKYAGRSSEAKAALESFLGNYHASPRYGEASVMLGWIHFNSGSLDSAQALFKASVSDRVASVRTSAEKGLNAVEERKKADSDVFN